MNGLKPMLASAADLDQLQYPLLASPKLDGIRALVVNGQLLSRKLKPIPNKYLAGLLGRPLLEGFDGELILGDPCSPSVFRDTSSAVMSIEGEPHEARFYCFDIWNLSDTFAARWHYLQAQAEKLTGLPVDVVEQAVIENRSDLDAMESRAISAGFEGLMLRSIKGAYKFGRSTTKEGLLLKLKRFEDNDCEVLGVVEEMHNANEAETDNLGRTKRSKVQAGLIGKGTMGALHVRCLKTKVDFHIGTGFTADDRIRYFKNPPKFGKYKSFPVGVKEKPRHPVWLGERNAIDIS